MPRAKPGFCVWSLHTQPPRVCTDHQSHPSIGTTDLPSRPFMKPTLPTPPPGMGQGTCFLLSLLAGAARIPVKPCLNFSSGLLPISTDYETGWDLRPFVAVLAHGHMSPCTTKYKKKLIGTKNNCVHMQLGRNINNKVYTHTEFHFWGLRSKSGVSTGYYIITQQREEQTT